MRRSLLSVATPTIVLAAAISPAVLAEDAATMLRPEAVEALSPFPTQRTDLTMFRPVGERISIGAAQFAVRGTAKGLRVATEPGAEPTKALREGTTVRLHLADGETSRSVRVHVRPAGELAWEYAVVEARAITLDHVTVQLLDVNGDGRFTTGDDGCRYLPSDFVLPLEETLVVGRQRVSITALAADGLRLECDVRPLQGSRHQLDGLVEINALRADSGLPPVVVDAELSGPCSDHAAYLLKHKWRPGKMNPHGEVRGWKGFTDAGHRAGQSSVIAWSDHGDSAHAFWETYYHRFPLAHPATLGLGVSDGTPSISVIDGKTGTDWSLVDGWQDPILIPADGAKRVPTKFYRGGESPEPVERPGSRGYPLTVQFLARDAGVTAFRGRLIAIDRKGREDEVPTLVPDSRSARNTFGLIPEKPLRAAMSYRVEYTFARHGEEQSVEATFTTR